MGLCEPPSIGGSLEINGGGRVWTGEPFQAHDFIPLSPKTKAVIFEKCAPLYKKGLSIRDIEEATGIPKSTIRVALTSGGMSLRNPTNGNARKIDRTQSKRGGHTPYGYSYLDGKLLIDPKEQTVARKILKLRHEGQTFQAIADELNRHKTPTRSGKPWIKSVIRSIILRTKGEIK